MSDQNNLPNNQTLAKQKSSWGGPRKNSGRKHGQIQKLSGKKILQEIAKRDVPFAVGLAEDYHNARISGDKHLIVKYQQMILNKVVADKVDVDHTTGGQPFTAMFKFPQQELPDWNNIIDVTPENK